jgi:hypothetical protein
MAEQARALSLSEALDAFRSNGGATLRELSEVRPLLVVFLRHAGCTFCREALADLQAQRARIEAAGVSLALVHMIDDAEAERFFARYGLADVPRFSDPERALYRAFDLQRGSLWQLLGPPVWWRGAKAFFGGHWVGQLQGDGFQMPGTFVLHKGQIVQAFRNRTSADRPDYTAIAESCALPARTAI